MNMLLATVYMLTDTDHDRQNHLEYTSILQEIIDMRDNLDIQHIIVVSNFNTDPRRLRSLHSIALNDILFKNNCFHGYPRNSSQQTTAMKVKLMEVVL